MTNLTSFAPSVLVKLEVAPVTGSTTSVPTLYDWVVYTNAGTIAAQTLNLPASPVDGQLFFVSNFAQITAFTPVPDITGFTTGGTLTAGQGLIIAYSVPKAVWFVVR